MDDGIKRVIKITSKKVKEVDKRTPLLKRLQIKSVKKELEVEKKNMDMQKSIRRILYK